MNSHLNYHVKKSILFVETVNEENKASIIRTISQSLIATNKNTVYNYVELGYSEYITSILQIDRLKVGVTCQKFTDQETYQIILDLNAKECDVIICVIQRKLENLFRFGELCSKQQLYDSIYPK